MLQQNVNSHSLQDLNHSEGRPTFYKQKKTTHNITVTPDGWQGIQTKAQNLGYSGVSELVEQIGRGQVDIERISSKSSMILLDNNTTSLEDNIQEELSKFKVEIQQLIKVEIEKIIQLIQFLSERPTPMYLEPSNKGELGTSRE